MIVDVPNGAPARVETPRPGDPRLARLSLNQRTIASWSLRDAIDGTVRAGLPAIGVWREPLAEVGVETARGWIADAGLRVSSVCRGGFFTASDADERELAHVNNIAAIEETAALGARTLVLVPGGLPTGNRDLGAAFERAADAIDALVPHARRAGVTLGIEPMHPIFAADRGVVSTLAQAVELAKRWDAAEVGVVVDTFHLWWEPSVLDLIECSGDRIVSYQVGDWITPLPADTLLSRGMVGDGHIDFTAFTAAVARSGYLGDVEVEIFNADIWAAPGDDALATVTRRYVELVEPHLSSGT